LIIKDWKDSDRGEYRCVASRSYSSSYRSSEPVYMTVDFFPYSGGYYYGGRGRYNDDYDSYFNRNRRGYYYPNYRSLALSSDTDRIIDEDKVDETSS